MVRLGAVGEGCSHPVPLEHRLDLGKTISVDYRTDGAQYKESKEPPV